MAKQTATDKILNKVRKDNRSFEPKSPIATGMYLPNHSGDHSAGRLRRTPENELDLVNKEYVDSIATRQAVELFLTTNASDIGTYDDLNIDVSPDAETTIQQTITANSTTLINSFASKLGEEEINALKILENGIYDLHLHAEADFPNNMTIYYEFYHRTAGGTETLLGTSHDSDILGLAEQEVELHANVLTDKIFISGDRIVVKVYGRNGNAANKDITIHMEGDTVSRVEFPAFISPTFVPEHTHTHASTTGRTADDHHTKYTDAEAVSAVSTADDYVKIVGDTMTGVLNLDAIGTGLDVLHTAEIGNHLIVGDNLTVDTNTLFVNATTKRVGIKDTAPFTTLHVSGDTGGSNTGFMVEGPNPTMKFNETDGNANENWQIRNTGGKLQIQAQNDAFDSAAAKVTFQQNGKVGIGTATPDTLLHIKDTEAPIITFEESGETKKWLLGVDSEDIWFGEDTSTGGNRRLTIQTGGKVGIGITSPSFKLQVSENIAGYASGHYNIGNNSNRHGINVRCGADDGSGTTNYLFGADGNGTAVGAVRNASGTFTLVDLSDERIKENIVDTSKSCLDIINQIRVRDFNLKKIPNLQKTGFIAQELKEIIPEAVSKLEPEKENSMLGISRTELIPYLVGAIKELKAEIEKLKK